MTMDHFLGWDKYAGAFSKNISSVILPIKVVSVLPSMALLNTYHSLAEPKLRYPNTVWGRSNFSLKSKLQNLQNGEVTFVSKDYSSLVEEMFINLKVTVPDFGD